MWCPALAGPSTWRPASAKKFFTALQEQLGLKLDAERKMVEVLIIDTIDRPAEH